jgi:hypothetical protein
MLLGMRRLCSLLVAIALAPSVSAQVPGRPPQADPVVKLLVDLEAALRSGRTADVDALTTDALPDAALDRLDQVWAAGTPSAVTVRERARGPVGPGYEVMADVLVRHGRHGRLVTWQIDTRPRNGAADQFEITNVRELASIDGLLRLSLDATRQFAVRDLTFNAPDLELKMSSGAAFVAESDHGVTGLVLLGRGDVHFAPPHPAEQAQLRIYAGQLDYRTPVDTVFIRIHPVEFLLRLKSDSLQPVDVDPESLRRAEAVFAELSTRTYNLDLRDLTSDAWSLEPSPGSIVVEFRSGRRNWLTYSRSPGENEDISFFERARTRNISVYASGEKLSRRGRYYSEDDNAAYDIERYDIDLAFDPARSFVSGRGSLRVRATRDVSALSLKLAEPLVISSVTAADYGPLLTLRVIGQSTVLVSFPQGLRRGATAVLDVFYSGRLPPQMLDREAITVAAQSGVQEQDRQVLAPEARYLYSNRTAWYPQSERSDYATAAMRLTVPSEFQVVASGSLVSSRLQPAEPTRGGPRHRRVVEYAADRPVRYLGLVISRFAPVGRTRVAVPAVSPAIESSAPPSGSPAAASGAGGPGVNVEVVATARAAGRNRQMIDRVGSMLRFLATTFGEAPYPDFTVVNVDDNVPGGHSPPFFAMLLHPLPTSTLSWADDPVAMEHIFSHLFLAHEVAHQWWGQAVGWKNYHEQWLSEGLAQYSAVLYAESERGPDVLSRLIVDMRKSAEELSSQGPIYLGYRLGHLQADGRIFRAIVYNKAAVVLHMLRRLVGDEVFFASLRDFYAARRFRKAGTDDFREVFEARSSRSLERFFERWIHNAELPQLRISSSLDSGGRVAKVRVQQLGDVFDLPVPVLVQYQDGKSEEIQVIVNEADREYEIPLKSPARRIVVREELLMMSR